jgi:predicted branched-subunit amino acid permease
MRTAAGVGVATGAYGLSFGAISVAAGLSTLQTCALSLLLFSGGSQFALVGILGGGGGAVSAAATAILLGSRNAFYGLRLSTTLGVTGLRRAVAAQITIDESTAVSTAQATPEAARLGFWATGISTFVLWNLGTLIGAIGAGALKDPTVYGFDAAAPAAFVALIAPRMRSREPWLVALVAAAVALVSVPYLPVGVPVLFAAVVAIALGVRKPAVAPEERPDTPDQPATPEQPGTPELPDAPERPDTPERPGTS